MSPQDAPAREAFQLPPDLHYLNAAYLSPLPRAVERAVVEGLARKRIPVDIGPEDFFSGPEAVRERFGRLIGGSADRVALLPAASYGISVCARNLPVARGQRIVVLAEQFPGNVYAWRRRAAETYAEVVTVGPGEAASPAGTGRAERWNERLLEAIDGDTAVVAIPHVHWADGTRFDLDAVAGRARDVGAALVIDGTQSVGALPLDVSRVRPDAVVVAAYKWLLAPYGTAVGWFGPRLDGGVPLEETWMAREGSEDFRRLVDYRDTYQPGARRYDVGQVANFSLVPGLVAALDLLLDWTPAAVQSHAGRLAGPLTEALVARGWSVEAPSGRADHLFGVRPPSGLDAERLRRALEERRVVVSLRGSAVRLSFHLYNGGTDVEALLDAVDAASR